MAREQPQRQIEVPMQELLRTMKALLLEHALSYERELDGSTGDWRWRAGPDQEWLTWETLPKLFEDVPTCHTALTRIISAHHEKRKTTASIVYNPGLQGGPWGARIMEIEDNENIVKAQAVASQQTLAIVVALLTYYNLEPASYHRIYFPGRYMELGNARANQVPRDETPNGGSIVLGRPPNHRH